jgi:hypothetical protein
MKLTRLTAVLLSLLLVAPLRAQEKHWYKGNIHTHTLWSDGDDFPEMAVDWYKSHGYDFVALSDHNVLSVGEKWMPVRDIQKKAGDLGINKYRQRFPQVVQVRHEENGEEIQLQPLSKVRELLEEPGKFILIQAEEVTDYLPDQPTSRPVHMGAVNVAEKVEPRHGKSVREIIANNYRAVCEEEARTGVPAIAHVNHPNFGWGVTAQDLADVVEERYMEVYNGHPVVHHLGDATHPGVEKLWDIANTIRLAQLNAAPLFGLGTDDTHHYHVPGMSRSTAGRGWTMVHASRLEPNAIIAAFKAGDYYFSSGVTLKSVAYDEATKAISLEINPDSDAEFVTQFIGTPKSFSDGGKTPLNSEKVGSILATANGLKPSYKLTGDELYVRATVTSTKAAANPSFEGQKMQAWTQPVGWIAKSPDPGR